jgi:hypothetical protein
MGEGEDDEPEIELGDDSEGTPLDVTTLPVIVTLGQVGCADPADVWTCDACRSLLMWLCSAYCDDKVCKAEMCGRNRQLCSEAAVHSLAVCFARCGAALVPGRG